MHRTQLCLEVEQYEWLEQEARRRGLSLAAVVREMIAEHRQRRPRAAAKTGRLAAIRGVAEGDGQPVGRNHNAFLYGRKRGRSGSSG